MNSISLKVLVHDIFQWYHLQSLVILSDNQELSFTQDFPTLVLSPSESKNIHLSQMIDKHFLILSCSEEDLELLTHLILDNFDFDAKILIVTHNTQIQDLLQKLELAELWNAGVFSTITQKFYSLTATDELFQSFPTNFKGSVFNLRRSAKEETLKNCTNPRC